MISNNYAIINKNIQNTKSDKLKSEIQVVLGSDHRGIELKSYLIDKLKDSDNLRIIDCGPFDSKISVDYPDYASKVCKEVIKLNNKKIKSYGVLICSTGIGMSITANKFREIRCGLCINSKQVQATREHNNSNVLALGSDYITKNEAVSMVKKFISTRFSDEHRHSRRVEKIQNIKY